MHPPPPFPTPLYVTLDTGGWCCRMGWNRTWWWQAGVREVNAADGTCRPVEWAISVVHWFTSEGRGEGWGRGRRCCPEGGGGWTESGRWTRTDSLCGWSTECLVQWDGGTTPMAVKVPAQAQHTPHLKSFGWSGRKLAWRRATVKAMVFTPQPPFRSTATRVLGTY